MAVFEPWPISDHGDHGPHADDHAQGRQGRPHLVPPQGPQGRAEGGRQQRRRRRCGIAGTAASAGQSAGGRGRGVRRRGHAAQAAAAARSAIAVAVRATSRGGRRAASVTPLPLPPTRRRSGRMRRQSDDRSSAGRGVGLVALDQAVGNADRAMGVGGHLGIVRHQDDGDPLGVELLEHPQDFHAGVRIEVAGGLVGQQQRRAVDQRPGDGHPLLLAAGHLRGLVVGAVGQPDAIQQHVRQPPGLGAGGPAAASSPAA